MKWILKYKQKSKQKKGFLLRMGEKEQKFDYTVNKIYLALMELRVPSVLVLTYYMQNNKIKKRCFV